MDICYYCGKEIELGHRCSYCNLTFCDDHRLPEQHNCINAPDRDWNTFRELKISREGYPKKSKSIIETLMRKVGSWRSLLIIILVLVGLAVIITSLMGVDVLDILQG